MKRIKNLNVIECEWNEVRDSVYEVSSDLADVIDKLNPSSEYKVYEASYNIDLTKTVGWLTVVHPIFLKIDSELDLMESICSIHEQLSGVPKNGLSYGLLRYLVLDESIKLEMENLPRSQIAFNYHGIVDSEFSGNDLFSFLKKTTGNNSGVNVTRSHLLNIDIMVRNEQINIIWTYSKKFHKRKTIASLQKKYESILKKVVSSALKNAVNV